MNHSDIVKKCRYCEDGAFNAAGQIACRASNLDLCCDVEKCPRNYHGGPFDFSEALLALKEGLAVTRENWGILGLYWMEIKLQKPDKKSKMGLPYIYVSTREGKLVPWTPTHDDLLANDWFTCGDITRRIEKND